jgi:hypothetical protein
MVVFQCLADAMVIVIVWVFFKLRRSVVLLARRWRKVRFGGVRRWPTVTVSIVGIIVGAFAYPEVAVFAGRIRFNTRVRLSGSGVYRLHAVIAR